MSRSRLIPKKARKIPRPKEPRAAELRYVAGLRDLWLDAQIIIAAGLRPLLDRWPERTDARDATTLRELRRWLDRAAGLRGIRPPVPDVVSARTIERQIAWCRIQLGELIGGPQVERLVGRAADATDGHARTELGRVLRLDLRRDVPGLADRIDDFRERNIGLIRTDLTGTLDEVSALVEDAHRTGMRVEALAGSIAERFSVSDSRAELIARDQVLKLNAQISQTRLRAVGVERYTWSASRDDRVRPDHEELDGQEFSFDDPPITCKRTGETNNPGEDFQCRCVAIPILPTELGGEP